MSFSRKDFLKVAVTGGLGAVFGGAAVPASWHDKGARLISVKRQSLVMGSVISFEVVAGTREAGYEAIRKGIKVFRSMDRIFSMYNSQSEMGRLAEQSGLKPVEVSEVARRLLSFAVHMYKKTEGVFDITIEPAMRRWGFRQDKDTSIEPPSNKELKALEGVIGSDKLILDGNDARLSKKGMAVDAGGIAGGYALDTAITEMKKCDISATFINFSGDIHCFGKPLDGRHWKVHIYDPSTGAPLHDPVRLADEALSTSGAYQNRRKDERENSWGHLLLPGPARPAEPVNSLTAIHSSAMTADAWSTAAYLGATPPPEIKVITL